MFAEGPRSELMDLLEKNKDFKPRFMSRPRLLFEIGKDLYDFVKNVTIENDPCNITVSSSLGTFNYRNSYCFKTKQEEPKEKILQKKMPDPPDNYCGNQQLTIAATEDYFNYADNINGNWFLIRSSIKVTKILYPTEQGQAYIEADLTFQHTYSKKYADYQGYPYPPTNANSTTTKLRGQTINYSSRVYSIDDGSPIPLTAYFGIDRFNSSYPIFYEDGGLNATYQIETTTGFYAYTLPNPDNPPTVSVSTPIRTLTAEPEIIYDAYLGKFYRYSSPGIGIERQNYKFYATCGNWKPDPEPPPPPKECDCMQCCPDVSNLEALLKLIIKRIGTPEKVTIFDEDLERKGAQKTSKTPQTLNKYLKLVTERVEIANRIIGIESFPVTVPDTMITPFKDGIFAKIFNFIDGDKKRKINSMTEFIAWMSEQDSAVLGEFHQVIEYEKEDKKTANIVLPNVAESLKEIILVTAQMAKQNNIQTELLFKMMAETIAVRAAATKGTAIVQDIQDYLDYPTQTKTAKISTSVSLPKFSMNKEGIPVATAKSENHKNFMKSGEIKYTYDDWTGDNSLHDQLLDLLQLAAMLRAIYFQKSE